MLPLYRVLLEADSWLQIASSCPELQHLRGGRAGRSADSALADALPSITPRLAVCFGTNTPFDSWCPWSLVAQDSWYVRWCYSPDHVLFGRLALWACSAPVIWTGLVSCVRGHLLGSYTCQHCIVSYAVGPCCQERSRLAQQHMCGWHAIGRYRPHVRCIGWPSTLMDSIRALPSLSLMHVGDSSFGRGQLGELC